MPELPEAETIARDLRARVAGRTVTAVSVARPDILAPGLPADHLERAVAGRTIADVGRRGKNVLLRLEGGVTVAVNLGMTGRLVASEAPRAGELRHVAARFALDDGQAILYDDVRRFGRIDLYETPGAWAERDRELGLEPLSEEFTADRLLELTRRSRTPIRNFLLDQRRVAGIGNIYANEALFRAGIHPARPADSLDTLDAAALRDSLRDVLREAIAARGTTFSDYRDAQGEAGAFEPLLRVYGREGSPCPMCGAPIARILLTNRSAFFCPECQR